MEWRFEIGRVHRIRLVQHVVFLDFDAPARGLVDLAEEVVSSDVVLQTCLQADFKRLSLDLWIGPINLFGDLCLIWHRLADQQNVHLLLKLFPWHCHSHLPVLQRKLRRNMTICQVTLTIPRLEFAQRILPRHRLVSLAEVLLADFGHRGIQDNRIFDPRLRLIGALTFIVIPRRRHGRKVIKIRSVCLQGLRGVAILLFATALRNQYMWPRNSRLSSPVLEFLLLLQKIKVFLNLSQRQAGIIKTSHL